MSAARVISLAILALAALSGWALTAALGSVRLGVPWWLVTLASGGALLGLFALLFERQAQ